MKFLSQTIKALLLSVILFSYGCKENKTIADQNTTNQIDTITGKQIKKGEVKDSVQQPSEDNECIKKSSFQLPYSQITNVDKVNYFEASCSIQGIEELLCGEKSLRYIPLPNFENRRVVLVPMDCGDFKYRLFLVTIFENKFISKLYVEGEWYEPGDDSFKEMTNFTIDEDYTITVTKKSLENGKTTSTEVTSYTANPDGEFEKES